MQLMYIQGGVSGCSTHKYYVNLFNRSEGDTNDIREH